MSAFRSWRWSALALTFAVASPAAWAEMISPDSIPNPPSAVNSANGTPVSTNNFVTTQYAGLGLNFSGTAITNLNGIAVWAPVNLVAGQSLISYYGPWTGGKFVLPGSSTPTTVSSLSVEILGSPLLSMGVDGLNGQPLNLLPVITPGPHGGGQVWTYTGTGIASFAGITAVVDPPGSGSPMPNPAWGVAGVSFTAATAPEPSSLLLAGLGALGMASRFGWRRKRAVIA